MTEQTAEPAFRKRVGYHGMLLAGFSMLAATLLVMGNLGTYDTIQVRLAEDLQASLEQVIPSQLHDNNLLDNKITLEVNNETIDVYQGIHNGEVSAVAFSIVGHGGYSGDIKLIIGINANAEVLGVRVISHAETPGLGDKIEAEKSDWIYSFNGLSFEKLDKDKWAVKKDGGQFDQFSGATITPRAVVKTIKHGLDIFHQQKKHFLSINSHVTDPVTDKHISNPSKASGDKQ